LSLSENKAAAFIEEQAAPNVHNLKLYCLVEILAEIIGPMQLLT
jgi:hypothetical protein